MHPVYSGRDALNWLLGHSAEVIVTNYQMHGIIFMATGNAARSAVPAYFSCAISPSSLPFTVQYMKKFGIPYFLSRCLSIPGVGITRTIKVI